MAAPPPRSSHDAPLPRSSSLKSSPSSSPSARSRRASFPHNPSPSRPTIATTTESSHIHLPVPPANSDPLSALLHHPAANSSVASLENILAMSLQRERSSSNASIGSKKDKSTLKTVLGAVTLERRRSSVVSNNNGEGPSPGTNSPDVSPQKDRQQRKLHKQRASGDDGTNTGSESGSDNERNRASIPKRINTIGKNFLGSIRRRKKSTGGSTSSIEEARGALVRAESSSNTPAKELPDDLLQVEPPKQAAEVIPIKDELKPVSPVPEESGAIDLSTPPPAQTSFPNIEYPPISAAIQAAEASVERSSAPVEAADSTAPITISTELTDPSSEGLSPIAVSPVTYDAAESDTKKASEPEGLHDTAASIHSEKSHPIVATDDAALPDEQPAKPSGDTNLNGVDEDHHSDSDLVMVDSASEIEKRREASFIAAEPEVAKDKEALPPVKELEVDGQNTGIGEAVLDGAALSSQSARSTTIERVSNDFTPPITPAASTQFSETANKDTPTLSNHANDLTHQTAKLASQPILELPHNVDHPLEEKSRTNAHAADEVPVPTILANQANGKEHPRDSDHSEFFPSRDTLDTAAQYALFTAMTHLNNHYEESHGSNNAIPLTDMHNHAAQTLPVPSLIPNYRSSSSLRTASSSSSLQTLSIPLPRRNADGQARIANRPSIGQLESQTARRTPASVPVWIPIPKLPQILDWSVRAVRYSAACSVTVVRLGSTSVNTVLARIWKSLVFW